MEKIKILENNFDKAIAKLTKNNIVNEVKNNRFIKYVEIDSNLAIEISYREIITGIIEVNCECYDKKGNALQEYNFISDNNNSHIKRFESFLKSIE